MASGTYDATLVILSILIAIAASFTALDLAGRIKAASGGVASASWLVTAALAMGGGIWSMHFVAMLAFNMPGMDVSYDVGLTLLSLILAIVVTGIGFFVVGWLIQFIGHWYEGRKPAFVDDLVGLLVGPMFVTAELLFALGWNRPLLATIEQRAGPTVLRDLAKIA